LENMYDMKIDFAVLLNLTPDHLKRHGDMTGYLEAKTRIFSHEKGVHVLGVDNIELEQFSSDGNFQTVSVDGKEAVVQVDEKGVLLDAGKPVLDLTDFIHLPGKHNWQNLACAYVVLKSLMSLSTLKKAIQSYKNLPHRMEKIAEFQNVQFYNDSKATNPESAIRALESFEHVFWICGGQPKDEGMKPCTEHLSHVEYAFVIGADTKPILKDLEGHVQALNCESMEEAVYAAWKKFKSSGLDKATILLSPACASWDQYKSFEHRGDVFVSLCHELVSRMEVNVK
jgi:UDP-N-acetylmuramoylalanine--D-glutamate ligase